MVGKVDLKLAFIIAIIAFGPNFGTAVQPSLLYISKRASVAHNIVILTVKQKTNNQC